MSGPWPKVLDTEVKTVRMRGQKEKVCVFQTREYPAGTEGGRYQLWIDGIWAEDITRKMEATKGPESMSYLDGHSADEAAAEREKLGRDATRSEEKSAEALAAALERLRRFGYEDGR